MKTTRPLVLPIIACALAAAGVSCNETEGPAEKMGEKVDDALDQRPAEEVRDAVEEATR